MDLFLEVKDQACVGDDEMINLPFAEVEGLACTKKGKIEEQTESGLPSMVRPHIHQRARRRRRRRIYSLLCGVKEDLNCSAWKKVRIQTRSHGQLTN
jgi:hypothetical protein